jgi:hypothetical protein
LLAAGEARPTDDDERDKGRFVILFQVKSMKGSQCRVRMMFNAINGGTLVISSTLISFSLARHFEWMSLIE